MLSEEQVDFYYDHPVEFFEDILQVTPDHLQRKILNFIPKAIRNKKNISVKSGHGVGKTFIESGVIIWFLVTRYKSKVIATAPTQHQLYDVLWSELSKHHDRSLVKAHFEKTASKFAFKESPDDWFGVARTSSKPENMQGFHAENMLIVVDEASGVEDSIMEVIEGAATEEGNIIMYFGNPTKLTGAFYESFNKNSKFFETTTMSCLDSTNVSPLYAQQIAEKYGKDSDIYKVRVLGLFPSSEADTVISSDLVDNGMSRDIKDLVVENNIIEIGCDVARFGGDETSIYARYNNLIDKIWISQSNSTMEIVGRIVHFINKNEDKGFTFMANIDDTGVGGGVTDRLRELQDEGLLPSNMIIRAVNNNGRAKNVKMYKNIITELWFCVQTFLKDNGIIPKDEKLKGQLISRRYGFHSTGRMIIESKDQMKLRKLKSPDRADGLILSCYSILGKQHKLATVREKEIKRIEDQKTAREKFNSNIFERIKYYQKVDKKYKNRRR